MGGGEGGVAHLRGLHCSCEEYLIFELDVTDDAELGLSVAFFGTSVERERAEATDTQKRDGCVQCVSVHVCACVCV